MRILALGSRALAACTAVAFVAGCGGSRQMRLSPDVFSNSASDKNVATTRLVARPTTLAERHVQTPNYNVSGPLLFVTNFDAPPYDGVVIYDPRQNNPNPIAVINSSIFQPTGDCVDRDGTLYVANGPPSGSGWIAEYALGETKTLRIITTGIDSPAFCAIDYKGNLWVTNSAGTVTEYLKGTTVPHLTLRNGLTSPDGIAIDRARNVYVGNLNAPYGATNIQVYLPGHTNPSRTITDGITWPVGIAVDATGDLYVANDTAPCNIEMYTSGHDHPDEKITQEIDGPTAVTFDRKGRLYEVNEGELGCASNGPASTILEFRPRAHIPSKRTISADLHVPLGATYYPPLLP